MRTRLVVSLALMALLTVGLAAMRQLIEQPQARSAPPVRPVRTTAERARADAPSVVPDPAPATPSTGESPAAPADPAAADSRGAMFTVEAPRAAAPAPDPSVPEPSAPDDPTTASDARHNGDPDDPHDLYIETAALPDDAPAADVGEIRNLLLDDDPARRQRGAQLAAHRFRCIGDTPDDDLRDLCELLERTLLAADGWELRRSCAVALVNAGGSIGTEHVARCLGANDTALAVLVALVIRSGGPDSSAAIADGIAPYLNDADHDLQRAAIRAACTQDRHAARLLPELFDIAERGHPLLRGYAIHAIGEALRSSGNSYPQTPHDVDRWIDNVMRLRALARQDVSATELADPDWWVGQCAGNLPRALTPDQLRRLLVEWPATADHVLYPLGRDKKRNDTPMVPVLIEMLDYHGDHAGFRLLYSLWTALGRIGDPDRAIVATAFERLAAGKNESSWSEVLQLLATRADVPRMLDLMLQNRSVFHLSRIVRELADAGCLPQVADAMSRLPYNHAMLLMPVVVRERPVQPATLRLALQWTAAGRDSGLELMHALPVGPAMIRAMADSLDDPELAPAVRRLVVSKWGERVREYADGMSGDPAARALLAVR